MGYLTLAKIMGPLLIISLLFAHDRRIEHLRAGWQEKAVTLVAVTAEVGGKAKLKVKDAPGEIRAIGSDRDQYLKQRDEARHSLQDQTDRVIALNTETEKLRAAADRAEAQIEALTRQRDGMIRKAQIASTRTQRKSFEAEAAECEAAMDALRDAGF